MSFHYTTYYRVGEFKLVWSSRIIYHDTIGMESYASLKLCIKRDFTSSLHARERVDVPALYSSMRFLIMRCVKISHNRTKKTIA